MCYLTRILYDNDHTLRPLILDRNHYKWWNLLVILCVAIYIPNMTPSSSSRFFSKTFYGFAKWVYYSWILTTFFKGCCIHTIWTFAGKQFSKNLIEYNRCHPNSSKNNTQVWSCFCSLLHYRKIKPGNFLLITKSTLSFTYDQYVLRFDYPKPRTAKSVYVGRL